jgi:hypothetical protein
MAKKKQDQADSAATYNDVTDVSKHVDDGCG